MSRLSNWLDQLVARKGTDLHLSVGTPPTARVDGRLARLEPRSVDDATLAREVFRLMDPAQTAAFDHDGNVVFAYHHDDASVFRVHFTRSGLGHRAVFRHRPRVPDPSSLGVPAALIEAARRLSGLLLITGRRGAGKRTTAACVLNALAAERAVHIVSLEAPHQIPVAPGQAHVTMREVGTHVASVSEGIESLRFENADVVFAGHLRPESTLPLLELSRHGPLVVALLEAPDVLGALKGLVSRAEDARNLRHTLAESLVALSAQMLVHHDDRPGVVSAFELLIRHEAVVNALASGELEDVWRHMGDASASECIRFDRRLDALVSEGVLTPHEAQRARVGTEAGGLR